MQVKLAGCIAIQLLYSLQSRIYTATHCFNFYISLCFECSYNILIYLI